MNVLEGAMGLMLCQTRLCLVRESIRDLSDREVLRLSQDIWGWGSGGLSTLYSFLGFCLPALWFGREESIPLCVRSFTTYPKIKFSEAA